MTAADADRPSWTGPDPASITAWTIVRAGHLVGQRFWQLLGEVGLTPVQFGALLALDENPGLANADLARRTHVTPQSMSELMGSLVAHGLVQRDVPAGRGRRVTARLTDAGRVKLAGCVAVIERMEASLGLDDAQRDALRSALHRVLASPTDPFG